jgi:dextranase
MKKIVYTTMVALLLVACSKESDDTGSGTGGGGESGGVTEVTPVTSDLTVNLIHFPEAVVTESPD